MTEGVFEFTRTHERVGRATFLANYRGYPQSDAYNDNNAAERDHRHIAIGRYNWMYVGTERRGRAAATHFSFIASCKMNGVEPFTYLVDVLNRLPLTSASDLPSLLPHRWQPRPAV